MVKREDDREALGAGDAAATVQAMGQSAGLSLGHLQLCCITVTFQTFAQEKL